ncbi:hypothetical protein ACFWXO_43255 [Kitasatospora sp. NPDC059088]|uniref:hypothetical protein n=1 Tax=Kitasatospora sp. NPDC059088 TaxID=3346722 RepID=UPI00368B1B01
MKTSTVTIRNVCASKRDRAGNLAITSRGDVTVTLDPMAEAELTDWQWLTDTLSTEGVDQETHRLTARGWKVSHPAAGTIGLLFQRHGTRVHIEWYDPRAGDFMASGQQARLRHAVAQVVNARQQHGFPLPVDPAPPVVGPAPEVTRRLRHPDGTLVRYNGSVERLRGGVFRAEECGCLDSCGGYELHPDFPGSEMLLHVRHESVMPLSG